MRMQVSIAGAALALLASMPVQAKVIFTDSFESPAMSGGYTYGGTDTAGAQFNPASNNPDYNGAGIQANGSAFGYQSAPDGVQTAFIQGTGAVIETVTGLTAGDVFTLSFFAAQRPGYAADPITVSYTPFTDFDPVLLTVSTSSTGWSKYSTTFVAQGDGYITFSGASLGGPANDLNVGVDAVSISTGGVPEISTWAMMLIGFGGIAMFAYRRKTASESATSSLIAA